VFYGKTGARPAVEYLVLRMRNAHFWAGQNPRLQVSKIRGSRAGGVTTALKVYCEKSIIII
jgi:hypothetical protein